MSKTSPTTRNEHGHPVWPQTRDIDGYEYSLESQHPSKEDADEAVFAIRANGRNAQAFTASFPKVEDQNGTLLARFAAVYTRVKARQPKEATEEAAEEVPTKKAAKAPKKAAKKAAKKST